MSERYDSAENNPCLFEFEIRALANMAMIDRRAEIFEANDIELQPAGQPNPHFFQLRLSPANIDRRLRLRPDDDTEVITEVSIEYNEPMFIPGDAIPMDPWVTVTVLVKSYDMQFQRMIDKEVRYRMALIEGGVCEVVETRSDENQRSGIEVDDIHDAVPVLAQEARSLTEDDLQFLRHLISTP